MLYLELLNKKLCKREWIKKKTTIKFWLDSITNNVLVRLILVIHKNNPVLGSN